MANHASRLSLGSHPLAHSSLASSANLWVVFSLLLTAPLSIQKLK